MNKKVKTQKEYASLLQVIISLNAMRKLIKKKKYLLPKLYKLTISLQEITKMLLWKIGRYSSKSIFTSIFFSNSITSYKRVDHSIHIYFGAKKVNLGPYKYLIIKKMKLRKSYMTRQQF